MDLEDREAGNLPELVPARMVNEFSYCPRLFFLEWVQGRFADSVDTVEGRWRHRVVDAGGGEAPGPEEADDFRAARSLQLSSEDLGLIATVDVVEGGPDGSVVPVDYKRGRPPDTPERAWEPERVQLAVAGLLLREAGYHCDHGDLFFVEARERVRVTFDDGLMERTMELLGELRRVAASDEPPPPLVDSPKCPRCSLVGLCLPDETNLLDGRSDRQPRRLVPRDGGPRPVYVTDQGAHISKDKGRLVVKVKATEVASVRLLDVSQLNVFGNVQVSSQVMRELMAREVPICFYSYGNWFSGIATGLPSKHVELRRRQVAVASQGGLAIARCVVYGKIRNSRVLLRRNSPREQTEGVFAALQRVAAGVRTASSFGELLGLEGAAARLYFSAFPAMLKSRHSLPGKAFDFAGRNRRPPRDAVNCLLSFAYGLLTKDLTTISHAVGFDPYLGFYHRPRFGRPALALDLAEELRPVIADSVVLGLVNNREVGPADFVVRAGGVALTSEGRRTAIRAYERRLEAEVRHPLFGYTITYRRVMEVQARLLGAAILGEIEQYPPFVVR